MSVAVFEVIALVSPLDSVRSVDRATAPGTTARTKRPEGGFDAVLKEALSAAGESASDVPPTAPGRDDLLANFEQVSASLRRANGYISSARAYFKNADGGEPQSTLDTRG